jgi:3alpha(or 20beta)-hydroxysteroid dehydrogenase
MRHASSPGPSCRSTAGRRRGENDIAPLVVYLISDESTYVNGTEISVDGGEWAHGGTKVYSDLLRGMDVRNG